MYENFKNKVLNNCKMKKKEKKRGKNRTFENIQKKKRKK